MKSAGCTAVCSKQSEPALCFGCHGTVQAEFALPVHHRVPEGLIKCTDCHNPHGSLNRASLNQPDFADLRELPRRETRALSLRTRVGESGRLHRLPHSARQHQSHAAGAARRTPVCLQCHTGFHGQAGVPHSRLGFQTSGECTRCHVAVHGSNLDPDVAAMRVHEGGFMKQTAVFR